MKVQIPFRAHTGKAALEIEIPNDTEGHGRMTRIRLRDVAEGALFVAAMAALSAFLFVIEPLL